MSGDPEFDEAWQIYLAEAREMLGHLEHQLLDPDSIASDPDAINGLFRAAHTIKGTSGIFNQEAIVNFTHAVEGVLDRMRKGGLQFDDALASLLLKCCDRIAVLLDAAERHEVAGDADGAAMALSEALNAYLDGPSDGGGAAAPAPAGGAAPAATALPPGGAWHLSMRFQPNTFYDGFDPLSVIGYLQGLGEIVGCAVVDDVLPDWSGFNPEQCYLGFELRLATTAAKTALEEAFDFVGEDCRVQIIPPTRRAADFIALMEALPHEQRLGEVLVACGAVSQEALEQALALQRQGAADAAAPALGQILVAQKVVQPEVVQAAVARQQTARSGALRTEAGQFVRVAADKLDDLINLVGELVICGASATLQVQGSADTNLLTTMQQLSRLVEEIRNGALGLRMVRIGETFVRYRRVVHDLSAELGKQIELRIDGADTELDKSVVEQIGDPLMHLVRNALDHGFERPEVRRAAGKPESGTLSLSARHDAGHVVIEVADDGRGLDGDKLLAKARERGLVGAHEELSDDAKLELVFAPGLSTADSVTKLSGRGVGMDVVRKNVEALRGSIRLHSRPGQGTTWEIRLPLTLAIIDGFLVQVGDGQFVIPLHALTECLDAHSGELRRMQDGAGYFDLRGTVLPVLDLGHVFGVSDPAAVKRRIAVVGTSDGKQAGLLVDRLLGECQTVIKPLGPLFTDLHGISGSTVLGSGEVALILDVAALARMAGRSSAAAMPADPNQSLITV